MRSRKIETLLRNRAGAEHRGLNRSPQAIVVDPADMEPKFGSFFRICPRKDTVAKSRARPGKVGKRRLAVAGSGAVHVCSEQRDGCSIGLFQSHGKTENCQ